MAIFPKDAVSEEVKDAVTEKVLRDVDIGGMPGPTVVGVMTAGRPDTAAEVNILLLACRRLHPTAADSAADVGPKQIRALSSGMCIGDRG